MTAATVLTPIEYYPGEFWAPVAASAPHTVTTFGTLSDGFTVEIASYRALAWQGHRFAAQESWLHGSVHVVGTGARSVTLVVPVDDLTPDVITVALYQLRVLARNAA